MNFPVKINYRQVRRATPNINIYYPVVSVPGMNAQHKINNSVIQTLNRVIIELGIFEKSLVEMQGYFEVKTNERNILSLSLIVYSFTGGAHGMTVIKSLTFNTVTGEQYTLKALFKPGSDYIKRISDIVRSKIKERDTPLLDKFKGIRPSQDFYLADHTLVIYFQLYEITPYVAGFPYFPIPILDLQDMIQPEGPLDILLPFY